jgi:hypothetical protein
VASRYLALDVRTDSPEGHAQPVQNPGGYAVVLAHQPQEQVLGADIVLAQARRFFLSEEDDPARSFCEPLPHGD